MADKSKLFYSGELVEKWRFESGGRVSQEAAAFMRQKGVKVAHRREWRTLRKCARELLKALSFDSGSWERKCVHCGCTDSRACAGGCAWGIQHKATQTGVCTSCLAKEREIVENL